MDVKMLVFFSYADFSAKFQQINCCITLKTCIKEKYKLNQISVYQYSYKQAQHRAAMDRFRNKIESQTLALGQGSHYQITFNQRMC